MAEELFGKSSFFRFKEKVEVISADSQSVYKGLDIGTAKPSKEEQKELAYHLIDIIEPTKQFGLGEFMTQADLLCKEIWTRKKIPLLIGGTGFYIKNFLLGCPKTPESLPEIRKQIKQKLLELGKENLYAELQIVDSESANKININDEYRICRALEIFYSSGKPLSSYKVPTQLRKEYDFCTIILKRSREDLYNRIDLRVEKMFEQGLESEVKKLKEQGLTKDSPAMKAIGYSEFFIEGLSQEQIKDRIKNNSHHYAKKQFTFMKGIPNAFIIDADDKQKIKEIVTPFLNSWLS